VTINPTAEDIGRKVIYRERGTHLGRKIQEGTLTAFNDHYAFVRYGAGITSAATDFADLEWSNRKPTETAIAATMRGGRIVEIDFCEPPNKSLADPRVLRMTAYPPGDGIAVPYERWELTVEDTGEVLLSGPMPVDQDAVRAACAAYRERLDDRDAACESPMTKHPTPEKPGFYWAQWRIADDGTQDNGDLPPPGTWEVVDVFENNDDVTDAAHLRVHVSGVSRGQSIENFFWGPGPLAPPNNT
jgi:hypothetical protein